MYTNNWLVSAPRFYLLCVKLAALTQHMSTFWEMKQTEQSVISWTSVSRNKTATSLRDISMLEGLCFMTLFA